MYVEVIQLYRFLIPFLMMSLHWICFSKFNCDDDVVNLFDSAGGIYISSAAEMAIANMMFSHMPNIFVRHDV